MNDIIKSTTIIAIRRDNEIVIAGDGQASFGATITIVLVLFIVSIRSKEIKFTGKLSFLSSLTKSMNVLIENKLVLLKSLVLSLIYWIMVGITAWIIAQSVDIFISPLSSTLVIMTTIYSVFWVFRGLSVAG